MGILDFIAGNNDASSADSSGLTEADRRRILFGTIGQLGAQLLAAGQPMDPSQRAQYLAPLGQIPAQAEQMRYNMAQQKLVAQKMTDERTAADAIKTPEFQQALANMPPEMRALAKISPQAAIAAVSQHRQLVQAHETATMQADRAEKTAQYANDRQMRMIEALNARNTENNQTKRDVAGTHALKPGEVRQNPDGSTTSVDVFGRAHTTPPPNAAPGPTSQLPPYSTMPGMPPPQPQPVGMPSQIPGGTPPAPQLTPAQMQLVQPPPPTAAPPVEMADPTTLEPSPHGWELKPEALTGLPVEEQRKVHNIATYKNEPLKLGQRSTDAKNTLLMNAVSAYTGGKYDPKLFKQIVDANKEMSQSGPTGKAISSMETAGGHMGDLFDAYQGLDNGDNRLLNQFVNKMRMATGNGDIAAADMAAGAVGEEVAKAIHGPGAIAHEEIKYWQDKFSAAAASPDQMRKVLVEARQLMAKRENAYRSKYQDDTGGASYQGKIWTDATRKKLDEIAASGGGEAKGPPGADFSKYNYRRKPGGNGWQREPKG